MAIDTGLLYNLVEEFQTTDEYQIITRVNVALVGCGGTGSFLALHLARLAWHIREQHDTHLEMAFVDPDRVEKKNVGRQNFVPAEIGRYKAEALATRYSLAFGLPIRYFNEAIRPAHISQDHRYQDGWLHLVIGCVDNTKARKGIDAICRGWSGRLWVSCADDALFDAQSLMINQAAAGWAASYVYRMIITHDLDSYATYFDLAAGSARSEYIQEVCQK